ncbi:nucleotidyltransferase substrate binding protein [Sulfobacillus acidophilus]|uniref:Nucleotidyltransferase substrate binding protein n=1 Tax=Sulfobacillus acidophilus TaxID=53633 RepID=A0ABS3AWR9_9FIRM|nr:nucleotidyltransferase substrate binding protein [Sulfobacillus acidophilus]
MERLKQRIEIAKKALTALKEALDMEKTKIVQDATIQRFEFTMEAFWKMLKLYLKVHEGVELASPKSVMRAALKASILNDNETKQALNMVDDRNLTVHTYNEKLANQIYKNIPGYYELMTNLTNKI